MMVLQLRGPMAFRVLQWCHPMLTSTKKKNCCTRMITLYGARKWIQARAFRLGGFLPKGCLPMEDVCLGGVCVCPEGGLCLGGVCPGRYLEADTPTWTEFLTHASENITFPQLLSSSRRHLKSKTGVYKLPHKEGRCPPI